MSSKKFYITTAIDYVNAAPHLGHAYEKIAADVSARYHRLQGEEVYFLTGTDEHGIKIEKSARSKGIDPKEFTDQISEEFKKAWSQLNLSYDRFIRTTDPDHYEFVKWMWNTLLEKGDIYKASYTGLYCAGCELFVTPRDLTESGECPNHLVKPEPVEEENYFFKLSKYKEAIKAHIEQNPDFILPEFRAQEVLKMLENLEDISVSRSKSSVSWGIPVPGDEDQRIYVWIDALSNYVTGVGYLQAPALFKKFWPADVHLIGKDILRFHAIYWPAMLMSAGIQLPKTVFAHGFITINEAKMGKSLGNIVSPSSIVERFELSNTDPIRYYLMTCTSFGQDGNYSEDDFKLRVNADLANNLGNLLNRTLNMTTKYFEGQVPQATLKAEFNKPEDFRAIEKAYDGFAFQAAAEAIFQWVDQANKLINESEPWTLFKNGQLEELANVLYTVLETLRRVAVALSPITPVLSEEIWRQLGYTTPLSSVDWSAIEQASLPAGQAINLQGPILPRLESEIVGAGKKK